MATEYYNGKNLMQLFNSLGVDVGNVTQNTIDALFDTDCEDTKMLLKWLCSSINCDNVLTHLELEEYRSLEEVVPDGKYENALEKLQKNYPGLLGFEANKHEVEQMQDELQILLEYEEKLSRELTINKQVSNKVNQAFSKVKNVENEEVVKREEAKKQCLNSCIKLEEIHKNLQHQIIKYSQQINQLDMELPTFLFCVPKQNYDKWYADIVTNFDKIIKKPLEFSMSRFDANSTPVEVDESNEISIAQQRVLESNVQLLISIVYEEMMKSQIAYLESLDLEQLLSYSLNENYASSLRDTNLGKKQQMQHLFTDYENLANQSCNALLESKLHVAKQKLSIKEEKLAILGKLDNLFKDILSRHFLFFCLLEREKQDIIETDSFFHQVYAYILDKLQNSEIRSNLMKEKINQYNANEALPIEEKNTLLRNISQILTGKLSNLMEITDATKNLRHSEQEINSQIFSNDVIHHQQATRAIKENTELMRTFLTNGPTNRIVVIPQQISLLLEEIGNLLEYQVSHEANSRQLHKRSKKQLENKWFRMRRQLWMWFRIEPTKILNAIEQIEAEVKKLRHK